MKPAKSGTNLLMICIDANLIIQHFVTPDHPAISKIWLEWTQNRIQFMAPTLIHFELANAFYRYRVHHVLSQEAAEKGLKAALEIPIELVQDNDLNVEAFKLADHYRLPATYDAYYLALALRHNVDFWTADQRLWNILEPHKLAWLNFVPY